MYYPQPTGDILDTLNVDSIRTWVRVSFDEFDDAQLAEIVEAAFEVLQKKSNTRLRLETFTVKMPCFSDYWIRLFPFGELVSIKYRDVDNAEQTLTTANYDLVSRSEWENEICYKGTLPTLYDRWDAVTITLTAGYPIYKLPANIKQAIRHLVRHWYDNPDSPKQEFPSLLDWIIGTFTNDVFA